MVTHSKHCHPQDQCQGLWMSFKLKSLPICGANIHTLSNTAFGPFLQGAPGSGDLEMSFSIALIPEYMNLGPIVGNFRVILLTGLLSSINMHLISLIPSRKGKKTGLNCKGF